ncbi:MAG: hypothetical protein R3253_13735, partial [Longimicrobiales bacterium]|nr:hypothetical protein [Longimicrobiales bacterium]
MSRSAARPRLASLFGLLVGALLLTGCGESLVTPDPDTRIEPVPRPAVVRGLYVNARAAGSEEQMAELLDLAERTGLNTFVIDVK